MDPTNCWTTVTPGTPRNDFTGTVGHKFTPNTSIVVTALGRYKMSGTMSSSHRVRIWRESDQVVVADVTVTTGSAVDSIGFAFEYLGSSVTLSSGVAYRIGSDEDAAGDFWSDQNWSGVYSSDASLDSSVYEVGHGYPSNLVFPSVSYVPPAWYTGGSPPSSAKGFPVIARHWRQVH